MKEERMAELETGLKGSKEMVVRKEDLASYAGNLGIDVLSTHRLVLLMEQAASEAIAGLLPEGSMTVGTLIHMRHMAATPLGAKVRAEAVLREVEGRRLLFDVVAYDEWEKIAEGQNERFIVSVGRFIEKVRKKGRENPLSHAQ
jgi:predicted thioesterase